MEDKTLDKSEVKNQSKYGGMSHYSGQSSFIGNDIEA